MELALLSPMDEKRPELTTPTGPDLRIVFEHTRGPRAGLREIRGVASTLLGAGKTTLPDHAENFFVSGGRRVDFASLIEVRRTCAIYRELNRDTENRHYPPRV